MTDDAMAGSVAAGQIPTLLPGLTRGANEEAAIAALVETALCGGSALRQLADLVVDFVGRLPGDRARV